MSIYTHICVYIDIYVYIYTFRFDWQRHVNSVNFSRQFVSQVSGLDIHFLHVKHETTSGSVTAYPILLLHGYPTTGALAYWRVEGG